MHVLVYPLDLASHLALCPSQKVSLHAGFLISRWAQSIGSPADHEGTWRTQCHGPGHGAPHGLEQTMGLNTQILLVSCFGRRRRLLTRKLLFCANV